MAKDSHEDIEIDPNFFTPPNVINLKAKNEEDGASYYDNIRVIPDIEDVIDEQTDTRPLPPTSFSVSSQTVRTTSTGTQVVDVILDITDPEGQVAGVKEYDIRIAKVAPE